MAIGSQLSTVESKKQTKQANRQKQNQRYGNHFESYQLGGGRERMGEIVQGLRSINW